MSAKKARRIKDIVRRGDTVMVKVKGDSDTEPDVELPITDLPRHELLKTAVRIGLRPNSDDGRWVGMHNEEIIDMINVKFGTGVKVTDNKDPQHGDVKMEAHDGAHDSDHDGVPDEGEGQEPGEGDATHPDQPTDIQPEDFTFTVDDDDKVDTGSDSLDEQIQKLQRQQEKRDKAREEYEEHEKEKAKAREEWNKAERERREQEKEKAKRAEEEEKEKADEFFEDFYQKRIKLDIPEDSHPQLPDIIDALMLGHDIYLAGPAGTGKSYLTEVCAQVLSRRYYSISFGPQTPESRLWGYHDANGRYVVTPFRQWYDATTADDNGAIFCGDEVDNGNSGITTTTNQALAGSGATFPDQWVDRHIGARMMCTANTWGMGATSEFMGRNPLDAAFLNRFTKFHIPTDEALEEKLVAMNSRLTPAEAAKWLEVVRKVRSNANDYKIRAVVSMRDAIAGAQLRSIGWSARKVLEARVLSGLPEARVEHLLMGVDV